MTTEKLEMSIEYIRAERDKVQKSIEETMAEFYKKTGLHIMFVHITNIETRPLSSRRATIAAQRIDLDLESI